MSASRLLATALVLVAATSLAAALHGGGPPRSGPTIEARSSAQVPPRADGPTPAAPRVAAAAPVGRGPTAYTVEPQPAPGSCRYRVLDGRAGKVLPDPACTPGATNPKVAKTTLYSTICRGGYTASIRPPAAVTRAEKRGSARAYGLTGSLFTAEYDHLVSLELGGDPNDPRNLWVEPNSANARGFANPKDGVENRLNAAVCDHRVTLAAAQAAIATNWTTAEQVLGLR